ncbi:hypothetical protein TRFO_02769 [Tritrichomonas foetus]|uniref:Regulator of chromosome condensation n=1 Tax=Tritrichomonas foetus TaxID=1144522 RepID=A0A1J4KW61_9EUKA|nr:hypothetical protein TRFO_02769 [Tritrichomonas foetus]|eukprot:OHT15475.1 hypothetical protein TRFO_02769 [Tritrichomonas foetus]
MSSSPTPNLSTSQNQSNNKGSPNPTSDSSNQDKISPIGIQYTLKPKFTTSALGCGTSPLGQIGQTSDTAIPTTIISKEVEHICCGGWTSIFVNHNNQALFLGCNKYGQIPHAQTPFVNTLLIPQNIKKLTKDQIACGDSFTAIINEQNQIDVFGSLSIPEPLKNLKVWKLYAKFDWLAAMKEGVNDHVYITMDEMSDLIEVKLSVENEEITLVTSFGESKIAVLARSGNLYVFDSEPHKNKPPNDNNNNINNSLENNNENNENQSNNNENQSNNNENQSNNNENQSNENQSNENQNTDGKETVKGCLTSVVISPIFEKVVSVASTRSRVIILKSDARVFEVINGRLTLVTGYLGLPIFLFAGGASLGLINYEGDCYMWGCGTHGQLGNGAFLNAATPQKVMLDDKKVEYAAAGEEHTLFLAVKENQHAVLLPELMQKEPLPMAVVAASTIQFGFKPPEFDRKF